MSKLDKTQLLETIQVVHKLFLNRDSSSPRESACYYAAYTASGCGSKFKSLLCDVQDVLSLKDFKGRRELERGREMLIKDGMMAKIFSHHEINSKKGKNSKFFHSEQYLPVNPILIYNEINQRSESGFRVPTHEEKILHRLNEYWKENFKKHGFLIEEGILTVYCTAPWLIFSLMNYLSIWKKEEKPLYIMTYSTNWCQPPFFYTIDSTVREGLEMKVLLDTSRKTKELEQLNQMEKIEVRHLPKEEVITKRLTFAGNEYVVDMHKILGTKERYSPYTATIYLHMRDIAEQFRISFEARWERASSF